MQRITVLASAGLIAVAFAIAGCGGSAAATNNAQATQAASTGATVPSAAAGGGTGGAELNACSLLSAAQASSLEGQQYTTATPTTIAPGQDQCAYNNAGGTNLVVIVYGPSSGVTFDMLSSVQNGVGAVTNVSGVGDKAIAGAIELDVQTGDRLVAVEDGGGTLTETSPAAAVAKAIIAALPQG